MVILCYTLNTLKESGHGVWLLCSYSCGYAVMVRLLCVLISIIFAVTRALYYNTKRYLWRVIYDTGPSRYKYNIQILYGKTVFEAAVKVR